MSGSELKTYYELYYPFQSIHQMACGFDVVNFSKTREIAFYWQTPSRWHAPQIDEKTLKSLVSSKIPLRLEMGCVYSVPVEERPYVGKTGMVPMQKELVFDLDIDESYDRFRCCECTDTKYCKKCWPLITAQAHVIDVLLKKVYNFKHILWVYSGRRGVHCWVLDRRAMHMTERARLLLVNNFCEHYKNDILFVSRNENMYYSDAHKTKLPRSVSKYLCEVLCAHFRAYVTANLEEIFCLTSKTFATIESICVAWKLKAEDLKAYANDEKKLFDFLFDIRNYPLLVSLAVQFCYPRIDAPVTQHMMHLLK